MSPRLEHLRTFLAEHDPPTPCLVVDIGVVLERYAEFAGMFAGARVQYAVKANPAPAVLHALAGAGAWFDVASPAEIQACLAAGAPPESLSYGHTIKKPADIAKAHAAGVREFTVEAASDLENVARHAPGAQVSARLLVDAPDSVTPFGRKFGCCHDDAVTLLVRAAELGLDPVGVSFHVGSQQLDTGAWDSGVGAAAKVFAAVAAHGVRLRRLNAGGGFGVSYLDPAPPLREYAAAIQRSVETHFPGGAPELVVEPGRAVVADAGLIRCEVVLVSRKSTSDKHRWVYLDIGRYNGLAETENEAVAYRLEVLGEQSPEDGPVIIAGPTCDGDDVLYQRRRYRLPRSLKAGDRLDIHSAGAYTASYSSVSFNGIEPLPTYCLNTGFTTTPEEGD